MEKSTKDSNLQLVTQGNSLKPGLFLLDVWKVWQGSGWERKRAKRKEKALPVFKQQWLHNGKPVDLSKPLSKPSGFEVSLERDERGGKEEHPEYSWSTDQGKRENKFW